MKGKLIIVSLYCCLTGYGQDSTDSPGKFSWNGYIKNLQTIRFDKNFRESVSNNLFHNRLNFKFRFSDKWAGAAEFRNRLFWGEEIKLTPGFSSLLRNQTEKFDLAVAWIDNSSMVLHTNTERLWLEYREKRWNVKAGRQRINWGIATIWNPNDIFNSYNFLDFDYEERPGTDGIKLQFFTDEFSHLELAMAYSGRDNKTNGAARYSWNKWQYDMQLLAGWFREQMTVGAGWAGNIGKAGFKGELQYFFPAADSAGHLNLSIESDYVFKNGWYVNAGMLYNNRGLTKKVTSWQEVNLQLSPQNLMPAQWNVMAGAGKELTPLFHGRVTVVYAPAMKMLILFPSLQYNIATNLDCSVSWQSFFIETTRHLEAAGHMPFFRIKWSF